MRELEVVTKSISGKIYTLEIGRAPKIGEVVIFLGSHLGKYTNKRVEYGDKFICYRHISDKGAFYVGDGITFGSNSIKNGDIGVVLSQKKEEDHSIKVKDDVVGVVRYQRTESDDPECVCCKGKHIHCQYVDFESSEIKGEHNFVQNFLSKNKNKIEGKKVKLTIEVID